MHAEAAAIDKSWGGAKRTGMVVLFVHKVRRLYRVCRPVNLPWQVVLWKQSETASQ